MKSPVQKVKRPFIADSVPAGAQRGFTREAARINTTPLGQAPRARCGLPAAACGWTLTMLAFSPTRQPSLIGPEYALAAVGAFPLGLAQFCLQLSILLKTSSLNRGWVCHASPMMAHSFYENSGPTGGIQMPPPCP